MHFNFYTEKKQGLGEDAEPICNFFRLNTAFPCPERPIKNILLGVFDGLGGAGSKLYTSGTNTHSGAYFASRIVKNAVKNFFASLDVNAFTDDNPFSFGNNISDLLCEYISKKLKMALAELVYDVPKIKSAMIKTLPTTASIIFCFPHKEKWYAVFLWAGDSRGYLLDSESGLKQYTKDDIKSDGDALDNLREDSPMSNYISADSSFSLNSKVISIDKPCILISATDGCFGYFQSPMRFEFELLLSLYRAKSIEDWKDRLVKSIQNVAQDDATLALAVFGWDDFNELKAALKNRTHFLNDNYIKKISEKEKIINEENQENSEIANCITNLWNTYKITYDETGCKI